MHLGTIDGLELLNDEPPFGAPAIDQLLGGETRAGAEIREVSLRRTRPDSDARRCVGDRPASRDERGKDVDLAWRCRLWKGAAQVHAPHASRLAAASHSSRPSIGML